MSADQLDLFAMSVPARAIRTGIKHICLPDFSLACGVGYLEMPAGDAASFGRPARWSDITCDWCRSIGRGYCDEASATMQRRPA